MSVRAGRPTTLALAELDAAVEAYLSGLIAGGAGGGSGGIVNNNSSSSGGGASVTGPTDAVVVWAIRREGERLVCKDQRCACVVCV